MKKENLIKEIIENLKDNIFYSQEFIFELVEESLKNRTIEELKEINN